MDGFLLLAVSGITCDILQVLQFWGWKVKMMVNSIKVWARTIWVSSCYYGYYSIHMSVLMYHCLNRAVPRYLTEWQRPSSPAVCVIYRSSRASYTSINNRRSGVRHCWPESMEQSTSCCPLLCHIQTPSKRPQISPFRTILLIEYFDYVQCSCRSLYRILHFTNRPTYIAQK